MITRETIARIGWGVTLIGALLSAYAFFAYDLSVEGSSAFERINNTGLLQRQMMIFVFGAICFGAGLLTTAIGSVDFTNTSENRDRPDTRTEAAAQPSVHGTTAFSVGRLAYARALGVERVAAGFEYRKTVYPELEEAIAAANRAV